MAHEHNHNTEAIGDKRLIAAIGVNTVLTLAQVVGGIVSGSLSLIADALHNLLLRSSHVKSVANRQMLLKPSATDAVKP